MLKTLRTFLIVTAACLTLPLAAQDIPPDVRQKLGEYAGAGVQAFRNGKYKESIESLGKFLEILPKDAALDGNRANAHYFIACAHANLNEKKKAIGHADKAFKFGYDLDQALSDEDLAAVHNEDSFKELVAKYRKIAQEKLQKFDFSVTTIEGEKISKKDFLGKVLIVDIWGTWCPPCRMEIPHFVELVKKYKDDGLRIVGLNYEDRITPDRDKQLEIVKEFVSENDINYTCALGDNKILEKVPNFSGFPTTLFIGRDGKPRKMVVGYHPLADLEEIIKPLLKEKPPNKSEGDKEEKEDTEKEDAGKKDDEKEDAGKKDDDNA